jgi:hypothetical protein
MWLVMEHSIHAASHFYEQRIRNKPLAPVSTFAAVMPLFVPQAPVSTMVP